MKDVTVMPLDVHEQVATRELQELEQRFLEDCTPNQFVLFAIDKRRVPPESAVVFPGQDWGPMH